MKHLRTKLLVVYISLTALVLLAAGILASSRLNSYFRGWIAGDMDTQARLVLASLGGDSSYSRHALQGRIRTLAEASGSRITLIAANGDVLVDSEVPEGELPGIENHFPVRSAGSLAVRARNGYTAQRHSGHGLSLCGAAARLLCYPVAAEEPGLSANKFAIGRTRQGHKGDSLQYRHHLIDRPHTR